jgi:hypothetical protein
MRCVGNAPEAEEAIAAILSLEEVLRGEQKGGRGEEEEEGEGSRQNII